MQQSRNAGLSLPELLVSLAVISILAGIALTVAQNVREGADRSAAASTLNLLNAAVTSFANSNWELVLAPADGTADEEAVFFTLQYRDPVNPAAGSPYLRKSMPCVTSSSPNRHRARWNGRYFELLSVGTTGAGLQLDALGGSSGSVPAPGFTPIPPSN